MLFIKPFIFYNLFMSFFVLSWKYPDIPTVYGSDDRPAKFPVLHSQLLIIKNGGHNIEEATCIYISLAKRYFEWTLTFPSYRWMQRGAEDLKVLNTKETKTQFSNKDNFSLFWDV